MEITYTVAKVAKEKGFKGENQYHQLIDWVFDLSRHDPKYPSGINPDLEQIEYAKITWLEFWYNLLKECPLKYEFKGRLLEWFRNNGESFHIDYHPKLNRYKAHLQGSIIKYTSVVDTYEEAEHQGILEIFKLLKQNG